MDLSDDLPEPAQRTAAVTGPELGSKDGGKTQAQGENGAEEQELVEKKVCDVSNFEKMVKKSLLDSFEQTDEDFLKHASSQFLLLSCDRLFKVFSPEEAVSFMVPILEEETLEQKEGKTLQDTRFETAYNRLANEALRRICADNVTVLLVNTEH
ncbi:Integrin-linked kinase-associated serine/threonine phosphatase 2C [Acipenser ruthenus]|uniref:Integrin-linked kinase-associated serine/threonine phosphatase 2C n=1 Tax=Acipenser ruthenus TaxID=7906 RepID=A0A662YU04_ACIRT|nr:Integrin-linked kinase-associated serine/threonine phosphatase 2C [Acipenser ruthenus]